MKGLPIALLALFLLALWFPAPASAATTSIWNWKGRAQVSLNTAYLTVSQEGTDRWQGASGGGAFTYSLHPMLSLYAAYDHGFPVGDSHLQNNQATVAANLLVYPGPGVIPGKVNLFMGAGSIWLGSRTIHNFQGWDAHLTGTYDLARPLVLFAKYGHGFGGRPVGVPDFDQIKVGVNALLWR
jgi:hypothetical protein